MQPRRREDAKQDAKNTVEWVPFHVFLRDFSIFVVLHSVYDFFSARDGLG